MKTIETYLPIFTGFYNTIFEPDEESEIDDINTQREEKGLKPIDYDNCEWDYEDYQTRVSESATDFIGGELEAMFDGLTVTYQSLYSPEYYNFSNDSINIEVKATDKALKAIRAYLMKNFEAFTEHVKKKNTSRAGFSAFYSNDVLVWLGEYFDQMETKGVFLGQMLEFIMVNEDIKEADIYNNLNDCYLSATNYDELIKG